VIVDAATIAMTSMICSVVTGIEECTELLFAQMAPLLDERLREGRKCGKSQVLGRTPIANRIDLLNAFSLICQYHKEKTDDRPQAPSAGRCPPAKVYAAIATQNGMRNWWTADTRMDETSGGKAEFGFDKRGMVFRMDILTLNPGKQVIMKCHGDHPDWDGTTLTWTIEPRDNQTILHFTQGGLREVTDFMAGCNSMWGQLMFRIKGYVEGKNPGPQWTE
jgi:uncharacterized protein YndB with AHSA1/START domain